MARDISKNDLRYFNDIRTGQIEKKKLAQSIDASVFCN